MIGLAPIAAFVTLQCVFVLAAIGGFRASRHLRDGPWMHIIFWTSMASGFLMVTKNHTYAAVMFAVAAGGGVVGAWVTHALFCRSADGAPYTLSIPELLLRAAPSAMFTVLASSFAVAAVTPLAEALGVLGQTLTFAILAPIAALIPWMGLWRTSRDAHAVYGGLWAVSVAAAPVLALVASNALYEHAVGEAARSAARLAAIAWLVVMAAVAWRYGSSRFRVVSHDESATE